MSSLSPVDLLRTVVRPALESMPRFKSPIEPYHSIAAEQLLIGTAAQESGGFLYLRQLGQGPALGIFQMEPYTYRDLWERCPPQVKVILRSMTGAFSPSPEMLAWDHRFSTIMARLKYRDNSDPLPAPGDIIGLARYWKGSYNTVRGKGTVEEFLSSWRRFVAAHKKEMWPDD